MDKKTFVQFLIFSALVLVAWWTASWILFHQAPRQRAARPAPEQPQVVQRRPVGPGQEAGPALPREPAPAGTPQPEAVAEPQPEPVQAVLSNGRIKTYWTSRGAALERLELLSDRYRAPYTVDGRRPVLALLQDFQDGLYSDTIEKVTIFSQRLDGALSAFDVAAADVVYRLVEEEEDRLIFEAVLGDGRGHRLLVRKAVSTAPEAYQYEVALEFENVGDEPFEFAFALRGAAGIEREALDSRYRGTRVGVLEGPGSYDVAKESAAGVAKKRPPPNESTDIAWAAVVNHYFVAVTEPAERGWVDSVVSRSVTDSDILMGRGRWKHGTVGKESQRPALARQNATVVIRAVRRRLEPGEQDVRRYRFTAAPKADEVLEDYDAGLPELIEFGLFASVSRVALALLNAIHVAVPNYGVAILVLTLMVRALLHPLTRKSQLGMSKMQKLQPQIMELQKEYGADKQKFTQEQMKLWQKYGVHPLSGCWPLFLQMPILISLFRALSTAIELRHAGFLWIEDLSRPDALFHLPFQLPLLGNEFNLLPILMILVMVLNQRLTPQPTSEQAKQQQKIMKFFPVFMGVLFYHFPSGLCLYFTTSTGVGAFERWLIDRKSDEIELRPVEQEARRKKRRAPAAQEPAKKGWLAKLAQWQEKLHEQPRQSRKGKGKKGGK
ncbi:MAG: YidC/Oxa1 family insertase periplasmic-domain containing protein [Planctomycetota bacterium]|jgi:YidC/Oxa1 family membrane protein insertase